MVGVVRIIGVEQGEAAVPGAFNSPLRVFRIELGATVLEAGQYRVEIDRVIRDALNLPGDDMVVVGSEAPRRVVSVKAAVVTDEDLRGSGGIELCGMLIGMGSGQSGR